MTRFTNKTMRLCMTIFVVMGLFLCCSLVAYAAEPTASATVCDGGVNVRSSYSTSASIVTTLAESSVVTVTKEKHTSSTSTADTTRWFYIQSGTVKGWVRADCVDVTYKTVAATASGSVNIRKGPSSAYDSVGKAEKGSELKVRLKTESASGASWYKVLYEGYSRYVNSSYVAFPEDSITVNTNFSNELEAFPSSYHDALRALHEEYPTWHFKANVIDFTWKEALANQTANYGTNTIPSSKPDSYKAVAEETYNFDDHYYYSFDGSSWLAASKQAVAYYMDPRNWLDEINVFMFESLAFDAESQKESMVKDLLSYTAIPTSYSSSYMLAGETYDISPVYLAAKSRLELGSSSFMVDGHQFTYGGKTYKGYYNAYNIGASDSASGSAALNGLYYAASGTSYLRPWNTLDKAIRGGAKFIAEDFIGNNQHTAYYEHFNVANSLSEVGTHVYMTNTMAAATHANITYWDYRDNGMIDTAFTFEIPVFQSMPAKPAAEPGKGNNNCYLDSVKVYNGDTRLNFKSSFDRFTTSYALKNSVGAEVDTLTVKATPNASDAKVKISGNTDLQSGDNKITVKVTSSAGIEKTYTVNVTKLKTSTVVVAPEIKASSDAETGKPVITWEEAINADEYKVYRSKSKSGSYSLLKTTTALSYTDTKAEVGTTYYYKVKSVGTTDVKGEATSAIVSRTCDLPRPVVTGMNRASDGKPQLTWESIDGAASYQVYRATEKDGTYTRVLSTTGLRYTNTSAEAGQTYYYKVRAVSEVKSAANSAYSSIVTRTCDLLQPIVTVQIRITDGKPQVTWEAIDGAVSYEVYRATEPDGEYKKTFTATGTSYTNTSAKAGQTYYYKVKAISAVKSAADSAFSEIVSSICCLPQPAITAKNRASDGKPQLTWEAIDGAASYQIFRAVEKDGTYKKALTTTGLSYTNSTAEAGQTYYYMVKAVSPQDSAADSAFSEIVTRTCDLPRPVITLKLRASDGKPKLTWEAIEGAKSYEIYRATSKDGTYKLLTTVTKTNCTNTSAVSGKKYYYKVRALSSVKSSANSAFSTVKSITSE